MTARPYAQLTDAGKARRHRATAHAAAGAYGLDIVRLRQLQVDTNFLFQLLDSSGSRYALRIQRPGLHATQDTELELWWLQQLANDGLPVPRIVPLPDGQSSVVVDDIDGVGGPHRCVMFEWLDGVEPDENDPSFWSAIGHLAAQLHANSAKRSIPSSMPQRRWDSVCNYEPAVLFDPQYQHLLSAEKWQLLRSAYVHLDDHLAKRYETADDAPPMLLHGDLHSGNVLRSRGRLSVLDFEDVIVGHPHHDLAILLYGPFYNSPSFDDVLVNVRSGYEQVRPWPISDQQDLRPLFAARALGMINFCIARDETFRDFVPVLADRVIRYLSDAQPISAPTSRSKPASASGSITLVSP